MKKKRLIHDKKYSYSRLREIPEQLKANCAYIVGWPAPWLIIFKCPCGCNATIQLNILEEDNPCWGFTIYRNRISIFPSIWRTKDCRSHFWIQNGEVKDARFYWTQYSLMTIIYAFIDSYFHR